MAREVRRRAVFRGCQVAGSTGRPADDPPAVALAESLARLLGWLLERALISGERTPQMSPRRRGETDECCGCLCAGKSDQSEMSRFSWTTSLTRRQQAAARALCAPARDVRLLTAVRNSVGWRNEI